MSAARVQSAADAARHASDCHDLYDAPPLPALQPPTNQGTSCHDSYDEPAEEAEHAADQE
ncbi:MAG TPA: hypothetical protein VG650_01730 [Mycobacteriales bacterium]|nr:hypothetical protein [Mycobacteriales bacterium]